MEFLHSLLRFYFAGKPGGINCQKFTIIFLSQGVCLVEVKWPIILQSLQSDQVRLKETPLCLKA